MPGQAKVVVPEPIAAPGLRLLREAGFAVVELRPASAADGELARELADAEALIVRSAVKVNAALLAAAPRLRVVGRAGVGVDNVDLAAAKARNVVVMNTPGGSSAAVAELTLGLMLALARHLPRAAAGMRAGQWEKKSLEGTELLDKTLALLGFGRIAIEVAKRARAFGMTVIAHDPATPLQAAHAAGVALVDFDQALARADYLSLHLSLGAGARGLLDAAAFAKMKPGVKLVNCARGEAIDEAALEAALRSGQVGAAALDVFRQEPPGASPLLQLPNVIATPHLGASTAEAQERVGIAIAEQVRDYLLHGRLANAVSA
jgi:D-3-phosphoglycerate dehydrogenase